MLRQLGWHYLLLQPVWGLFTFSQWLPKALSKQLAAVGVVPEAAGRVVAARDALRCHRSDVIQDRIGSRRREQFGLALATSDQPLLAFAVERRAGPVCGCLESSLLPRRS